ncbi:kinase-like domain-containing protein [Pestalotiopsis sp. NC0098]|nr:kinase-like domain-containing protein [Pestalotiopsis sp. NC0098]
MADAASGWQTVQPSAHSRVDRLEKAQLAAYERQALDLWAKAEGDWSGCGKHTTDAEARKLHAKLKSTVLHKLGRGGQGEVEKLNYTHKNRSVVLARKRLKGVVNILRAEADNLERLCHEHIVRLIGTYGYHQKELYLLLWPAATRDLASLLNDLDDLRFDGGDREDILERLAELELHDTSGIDEPHAVNSLNSVRHGCPLDYLRRSMGCLTEALRYCHGANIRHLDLKPANILVSPGRVHLADFGISRDVSDLDHTNTYQEIGTRQWFAPERFFNVAGWSMKAGGDIYSLGLVFLNVAAIMYGMRQSEFLDILKQVDWNIKLKQLKSFQDQSEKQALATQEFADAGAPTYRPKHIIGLVRSMTEYDPEKRPDTAGISRELCLLGGLEQLYFNPCCQVSPRALTQLLDENHAKICNERDFFAKENERMSKRFHTLEAAEETYEMRLYNQQQKHARDLALVTKQLEEAKMRNEELESKSQQNHSRRSGQHRPPKSPNQQHSKPANKVINAVHVPSAVLPPAVSPEASRLPEAARWPETARRPAVPEMRKSTDSLTNYTLRPRTSGSRLPQPINPSTPIRSGTPSTPRDANLTDSTNDSMSSSIFSRKSRRTSSGLSPNPSPGASRILGSANSESTIYGAGHGLGISNNIRLAPQAVSKTLEVDILSETGAEHGGSAQDGGSQVSQHQPSSPIAKSWAAIAGDKRGLTGIIGAASSVRKNKA